MDFQNKRLIYSLRSRIKMNEDTTSSVAPLRNRNKSNSNNSRQQCPEVSESVCVQTAMQMRKCQDVPTDSRVIIFTRATRSIGIICENGSNKKSLVRVGR